MVPLSCLRASALLVVGGLVAGCSAGLQSSGPVARPADPMPAVPTATIGQPGPFAVLSLFSSRRPPLSYDVRAVTVMAATTVPITLLQGVERRLSAAVAATQRSDVLPRVIVTVKISRVQIGIGLTRRRNEATVAVTAASVETGAVVAEGTLAVQTETLDPTLAPESLAEEIASRLRGQFHLSAPRL